MKKSSSLIIVLLFALQTIQSQESLNNYAYVIVPEQFHFQKEVDEYQLNSLSKFLFGRAGMKAFKNTEKIPNELVEIDCGGLRMKLNKESSAFRIKLSFELVNCRNQIVFKSELGSTTHKDFKKGYQESVRNAFKSFEALGYKYEGKIAPVPVTAGPIKVSAPKLVESNDLATGEMIFSNDNLSIVLNENNGSFLGKVFSSKSINYTKGDLICKLFKTSLPNVFKVEWKDTYGNFVNTIGYFNENGSLNIDMATPNGIAIMTFKK